MIQEQALVDLTTLINLGSEFYAQAKVYANVYDRLCCN